MATLVIQQDFLWPVSNQVNRVSDYSKAKGVSRLYLCLAQSDPYARGYADFCNMGS